MSFYQTLQKTMNKDVMNTNYGVCSLEEEALLIEGAREDLTSAEGDFKDLTRMEETTDSLEELTEIVDAIEEPTENDAALVDNAVQMATAGTPAVSEEIVPEASLESAILNKTRISTEGIKSFAMNIVRAVIDYLKKLYEKIEGFFHKILGQIPRLKATLRSIQKQADEASGKTKKDGKVKLGAAAAPLSVNYSTPKNESDIAALVTTLKGTLEKVYGTHAKDVADIGSKLAAAGKAFKAKDASEVEDSAKAVLAAYPQSPFSGAGALCTSGSSEKRFNSDSTSAKLSAPLAGNRSVVFIRPTKEGSSTGEKLRNCKMYRLEVMATKEDGTQETKDAEMEAMSLGGIGKILDNCIDMLDSIEKYQRGGDESKIKKAAKDLNEAMRKSATDIDKNDELNGDARSTWRAATAETAKGFAHMALQPQASLASLALTTCRAVAEASRRSISHYESK